MVPEKCELTMEWAQSRPKSAIVLIVFTPVIYLFIYFSGQNWGHVFTCAHLQHNFSSEIL
jgi:hypothetical protein